MLSVPPFSCSSGYHRSTPPELSTLRLSCPALSCLMLPCLPDLSSLPLYASFTPAIASAFPGWGVSGSQALGNIRHHHPPREGPETRALPPSLSFQVLFFCPLKHPSNLSYLSRQQYSQVNADPHLALCSQLTQHPGRASSTSLASPRPTRTCLSLAVRDLAWPGGTSSCPHNKPCSFMAPGLFSCCSPCLEVL